MGGDANGGGNMAGRWTAAVVVSVLTLLMVFVWDRIQVGAQLEDSNAKINLLQQEIDKLTGMKETQIKDEGTIIQNTHDIEDLKRRLDAVHAR